MKNISVITINYNNAIGLEKTIESVVNQDFINYEHIIIDGKSTDKSLTVLENYKNNNTLIISEPDSGVYNAMNKGIRLSGGEYLLFLNSGDTFHTNQSLSVLWDCRDHKDLVYGNIMVTNENKKPWVKKYPANLTFHYFLEDTLPHPASLISRKLFDSVGYYDEGKKIVSDWQFFMDAVCKQKASYKYVDAVISNFQFDGMSSKKENADLIIQEKTSHVNNTYKELLQKENIAFPLKRKTTFQKLRIKLSAFFK